MPRCSVRNMQALGSPERQQLSIWIYTSYSLLNDTIQLPISLHNFRWYWLCVTFVGYNLKVSIVVMCVAVSIRTMFPAKSVGITFVVYISVKFCHLPVCDVSVFVTIKPKAKRTLRSAALILNPKKLQLYSPLVAPIVYCCIHTYTNNIFLF